MADGDTITPRPNNLGDTYGDLGIPEEAVKTKGGRFTPEEIEAYKRGAHNNIDGYAKGGNESLSNDSFEQRRARARVDEAAKALADPDFSKQAFAEFELNQARMLCRKPSGCS